MRSFNAKHFTNNETSFEIEDQENITDELEEGLEKEFEKFKNPMKKMKNSSNLEDSLEIFEKTGIVDEKISKLIEHLQTIQPTSILTERTFSICGDLNRLKRNRMSFSLLNSLVILKYLN